MCVHRVIARCFLWVRTEAFRAGEGASAIRASAKAMWVLKLGGPLKTRDPGFPDPTQASHWLWNAPGERL